MKQLIYIIIICLLGANNYTTNAQHTYKSIFGKDSTHWDVVFTTIFPLGLTNVKAKTRLIFKNDTLVDGHLYKQTYIYQIHYGYYNKGDYYIREDTLSGKVWGRTLQRDTSEYLVFDFNLETGDTFKARNDDWVAVVDSTAIVQDRKRIYFRNIHGRFGDYTYSNEYPLVFIEGIGAVGTNITSLAGPSTSDRGEYLLCAYKDGIQDMAYTNAKFYGECDPDLEGTSITSPNKLQLQVYPNPASQHIILTHLPSLPHSISLLDIQGRTLETVNNNATSCQLDISAYSKGIYILKVNATGYSRYIQKIEKL